MEEWMPIPDFPGYLVSSAGYVQHERRSKDLTRFVTPTGTAYVGLTVGNRTHNRSLALLVANAFLPTPRNSSFTTPINLNGNRLDNRAENLKWRPLWFARKYFHQFPWTGTGYNIPILLLDTGEVFPNSWAAATRFGLLNMDLTVAIANRDKAWPTQQIFRPVK